MTTIIRTLKDQGVENWKMLHGMYEDLFLHREGYAFAIALHQGLGWPLVGVIEKGEVTHAGVRSPDGRVHDVRGFVSEEEFVRPFSSESPYDLQELLVEDLLVIRPVHESAIKRARQVAETLWPELPWRSVSISKVVAFVEELEVLCRKHNLWIRPPFSTQVTSIQEGDGGEKGFTVGPSLNGFGHTLELRRD